MSVNWYPGHMAKAKKQLAEMLRLVDMVVEIRDARIPRSSANPDLTHLGKNKKHIIVLSKKDYADPGATDAWIQHFEGMEIPCVAVNLLDAKDVNALRKHLNAMAQAIHEYIRRRKHIYKTVRAMVLGIPNVGKSTLINALVRKAKAKTADTPGVTRVVQWIAAGTYFELMDTPGLLWPRLDQEETAGHLAYTGAIRDELLDREEMASGLIAELLNMYPEALSEQYGIHIGNPDPFQVLESICIARGCLKEGGAPDTLRGAILLLDDFRGGKLGQITLEKVQ
jgi:ribosome biogenesis GTPase A